MVSSESIKISKKTKGRLDSFKIHKRETYDEVIIRMFDNITFEMKGGKTR